jgi:uncharacterized protein (DUF111 family)
MRIAHVHGHGGLSAPLLLGACLDAGAPLTAVESGWQSLGLPIAQVSSVRVTLTRGAATRIDFPPDRTADFLNRQSVPALLARVNSSGLADRPKQRLSAMLSRYAAAVDRVYGGEAAVRPEHLSEIVYLGSGVVLALEELGVDEVVAAPLPLLLGSQSDDMPLLNPLLAELCRGASVQGQQRRGDACGAPIIGGTAILTAIAGRYGPLPDMTLVATGYAAQDDAPHGPRLQIVLGDREGQGDAERVAVIETHIDDMNPELYEAVFECLFAHGALDVTLTPLFMKKNRPAHKLTVLSPLPHVDELSRLILQYTSSFGVRIHEAWRHKLERFHRHVDTRYGRIAVKCGTLDERIVQAAPEYDACKRAAQEHGVPVRLVYAEAARLAASWLSNEGLPG